MSKIHIGSSEKRGACVIGAGLSGLIAIKYLQADGLDVLAIEAKSDIGGTWNKSQNREVTQQSLKELYGNYLPEIYDNLNTNVHEVFMTFRDMPLRNAIPTTIVTSSEFYQHVHDYANTFKLKERILFNKLVSKIRLISNLNTEQIKHYNLTKADLGYKYIIITRDATSTENVSSQKEILIFCDYIVCCNGTYASPNIPALKDRNLYTAEEMHTSDYTDMASFRAKLENKRVVVVGSGISGRDMVNHIVQGFKHHQPINVKSLTLVMSSDADTETFRKAQVNYKRHAEVLKTVIGPVTAFTGPNTLKVKYGTVDADMIIWATGYKQSMPFLDSTDDILHIEQQESRGHYVYPMYMKTFSINQPSFAKMCDPFIERAELILTLERQMSVIAAVFSGRTQLPSKEKMLTGLEQWINRLKSQGHSLKSYCKEIPGINDQKTLLKKWYKYSGHIHRNDEIDKFTNDTDKAEQKFIDNGHFFAPPQLSFTNLPYNGDYSSSKF